VLGEGQRYRMLRRDPAGFYTDPAKTRRAPWFRAIEHYPVMSEPTLVNGQSRKTTGRLAPEASDLALLPPLF
jgi:hypothetical protein